MSVTKEVKPKNRYLVFAQYTIISDNPKECFEGPWQYMGETYAVSEAKAINNIRFSKYGKTSSKKDLPVGKTTHAVLNWRTEKKE